MAGDEGVSGPDKLEKVLEKLATTEKLTVVIERAPEWVAQSMSALPPKADMVQLGGDVRFVPIADIPPVRSITRSART